MRLSTMRTGSRQGGVALLEALIGILIFSIGILAVVGMQATAIRTVSDAKYRSEAAFLANQLMTQIWTDAGNVSTYAYTGSGTPPTVLNPWLAQVDLRLPGTATVRPVVTVTSPSATGALVQIQVFWQLPEEASQSLPARSFILLASVFTS